VTQELQDVMFVASQNQCFAEVENGAEKRFSSIQALPINRTTCLPELMKRMLFLGGDWRTDNCSVFD
jgi:hypothetical protein